MKTVRLARTGQAWTFAQLPKALTYLGVWPDSVLHVGGHLGQEVQHYRAANIGTIVLVEPTPDNAEYLRSAFPDVTVIEAAAGSEPGEAQLHIGAGDGCWNTLRDTDGPAVTVKVVTVAEIQGDADMLVVDTQGTELDVLASADLDPLVLVVVEAQTRGLPDAAPLDDVTAYMRSLGWDLGLVWNHDRRGDPHARGYVDAFYVRC